MKILLSCLTVFLFVLSASGQKDTLPEFSVNNINGQIIIRWHNVFKNAIQINIQRSKEFNKGFITIHSTPDPRARQYRYTDKTAPHDSSYYRIFMLFEGTNYQFSKILRPVISNEISSQNISETLEDKNEKKVINIPEKNENKKVILQIPIEKKQDEEILKPENEKKYISKKTDNGSKEIDLVLQSHNYRFRSKYNIFQFNINAPPAMPMKKGWTPSSYIFTGDDGNITIRLPDVKSKKYVITFLKEEGRPLFVLNKITESPLTIDKSSFLRSGWYYFELRQDDKVLERNKALITRDN